MVEFSVSCRSSREYQINHTGFRAPCPRLHSQDLVDRYSSPGGGILFVNLIDKQKEQGTLGVAFDAALESVAKGWGLRDTRSSVGESGTDTDPESATASGARTCTNHPRSTPADEFSETLSVSGSKGKRCLPLGLTRAVAVARDMGPTEENGNRPPSALRHVWFDFHREVRLGKKTAHMEHSNCLRQTAAHKDKNISEHRLSMWAQTFVGS